MSPEAAAGGPIALVHEGDTIAIDIEAGTLELRVGEEELARRRAHWQAPAPKYTTGVLSRYAKARDQRRQGGVSLMMNGLNTMLAQKQRAIEGKPLGPGSQTEHQGKTMTGAQAIIASLEAEGVDTLFGYPGGQAIKIYDALYDSKKIHHVLARHEQGATHMADGYARATGRVGVVLVTSGPGATNTVTGIATAYMDSIPMVVITGQVTRGVIGTDAFQEADIVGITMPVVKHSFLLQSTDDLTRTFREAFYIASTGRPGPVLIDIPSDLAGAQMVFNYPESVSIPSYRPTYKGNAKQIRQAVTLMGASKRPLLYAGGGIMASHACEELIELAELLQIPVVTTLLGKGAFPSSHPLRLRACGHARLQVRQYGHDRMRPAHLRGRAFLRPRDGQTFGIRPAC